RRQGADAAAPAAAAGRQVVAADRHRAGRGRLAGRFHGPSHLAAGKGRGHHVRQVFADAGPRHGADAASADPVGRDAGRHLDPPGIDSGRRWREADAHGRSEPCRPVVPRASEHQEPEALFVPAGRSGPDGARGGRSGDAPVDRRSHAERRHGRRPRL
ncbi:hypothetical protein OY671_011877, partial [Metschnikowia pulcherrima]